MQQLSSEIKLRIRTAPGTTIYPNISLSRTWSRIAKGTPILIIALTGRRPVSGSDTGIGHGDRPRESAGHVTFRQECLRHLSWSGDTMAGQRWTWGTWQDSGGRSSTYMHRDNRR